MNIFSKIKQKINFLINPKIQEDISSTTVEQIKLGVSSKTA